MISVSLMHSSIIKRGSLLGNSGKEVHSAVEGAVAVPCSRIPVSDATVC